MLKEDDFALENIAPENGISRSSFSEAINNKGLDQLKYVFEKLSIEAFNVLPDQHADLDNLVAKVHPGFNLNQGIPAKIFSCRRQRS